MVWNVYPNGYFSRTPLIRTLVIWIGLALRVKYFFCFNYTSFYGLNFPGICQMHIRNYLFILCLYGNKYVA